jgi:hypothetical protein
VGTGDALACTCANVPARQRLDAADAAFIGRVLETRPAPSRDGVRELVYVFTVDNVVKGEIGATVDVESPADPAACGFELEREETSAILLRRDVDGEGWIGGLCGQMAIGELIAASEETDESLVNWGGVVVGLGVLGVLALLLARRLRARR